MNGIARTLTASILALGLLQPGRAFVEPESAPTDESPPSLDELLGLEEDESETSAAEQAQQESGDELQRRLSEEDLADLFSQALEKMALSAHLLEVDFESGLATQRAQQDVLAKLDQLIDRARELSAQHSSSCSGCAQCSGKSGSAQRKPGSKPGSQTPGANRNNGPAQDSQATDAPPGREGDINTILEETGTEWGHLPARIRQLLKQGRGDYKSPLYRKLTEEYYKRLAEEGSS
ncbi:MAG: hypothetical protein ACYS15_01235 [Planctomycetota bacterium]|jgi:hypothetical protein